ncbi:MAG: small basic family protein [Peptoniphilus sp.]|nr:small basic family protein [Peptoniphilus sp.]
MIIIVTGVIIGILLGIIFPYTYNPQYSLYVSIAILACLDSIIGGARAMCEDTFDGIVFLSGLIMNGIIAGFFALLGDKVGIPLYYAPIVTFGGRIFDNIARIRRFFIDKLRNK